MYSELNILRSTLLAVSSFSTIYERLNPRYPRAPDIWSDVKWSHKDVAFIDNVINPPLPVNLSKFSTNVFLPIEYKI